MNDDSAAIDRQLGIALGQIFLAHRLSRREKRETVRWAKAAAIVQILAILKDEYPEHAARLGSVAEARRLLDREHPRLDALSLLVESACRSPFPPRNAESGEQFEFDLTDLDRELRELAELIGLKDEDATRTSQVRGEAADTHRGSRFLVLAGLGVGGAALFAAGGWVAAPLIGGLVGSAAGLSGAAATSAGLATLGGGSLAAGGFGVAGGISLLTGAGAIVGGSGSLAAAKLWPAPAVRQGMILLQTRFRIITLDERKDFGEAARIIAQLQESRAALNEELERLRTDDIPDDKQRPEFKELHDKIAVFDAATGWMARELAKARELHG